MNFLDSVFYGNHKMRTVNNPITLSEENCTLLNTKKENYYIHNYNPKPYLDKLKKDLKLSDEYLSRFNIEPRSNCCNVISIVLYIQDCEYVENIIKYLNSINRTVKNVNNKLKDWIVRLYLDESVYECIAQTNNFIEDLEIKDLEQENIEINKRKDCIKYFNNIKDSPNVEIYTFYCGDKVSLEETRTYRYLVLIDPEVNISAIREADGYINNLECHNLKMFQNSDKLFYVPPIGSTPNLVKKTSQNVFFSYSAWLQLYKNIFERNYFSNHQNIYDLLAGLFTIKLKLKPDFYYNIVNNLYNQIYEFENLPTEIINKYAPEDKYPLSKMPIVIQSSKIIIANTLRNLLSNENHRPNIIKLLNQGFDEILLLDIFKEIISVEFMQPTEENKWRINLDETNINIKIIKSLFLSYDSIKSYTFNSNPTTPFNEIIDELKLQNIIPRDIIINIPPSSYMIEEQRNALIDGIILKNIIADHPFNINFNPINNTKSVLDALNLYYSQSYEPYYNDISVTMRKYLKYKHKYLSLRYK